MLFLAKIHHWDIRPEGWIHWFPAGPDSFDVPRGPLGVMCYLVFVPLFWMVPKQWRSAYLIVTSLMVTLATLGPAFALSLAAAALGSFAVIRVLANPRGYPLAVGILVAAYGGLIYCPQPPWLPPVREPLFFYVHWAGIAYLLLRTLHVLADVTRRKTPMPSLQAWLAYCLFAPALRMGPIHRIEDFTQQLHGNLAEHRQLGYAAFRMFSGIVRLVILGIMMDKFNSQAFFDDPWQYSTLQFIAYLYLPMFLFFLWISGYVELSIGVARAMGFVLPENFNYPFLSVNIAEFWTRWHITLGAWLRDYVFTPLVRKRCHFFWAYIITFTLCGAWHCEWQWVISGAIQGLGLGILRLWSQAWKHQHSRKTPFYLALARWGLVGTSFNSFIAWVITFHYEAACSLILFDNRHAATLLGKRIIEILTGYPMH